MASLDVVSIGDDAVTRVFPQFSIINKYGFFVWNRGSDSNEKLKSFENVTSEDIQQRLKCDEKEEEEEEEEGRSGLAASLLEQSLKKLSMKNKSQGGNIGKPPALNYSHVQFPVRIKSLPPQEYPNRFPNDPGYIVPLFVALKRGLDLSQIDFVLGGSALEVLANQQIDGDDTKYLVQRVRNIIFICKSKEYIQNFSDAGYQFERLVTGGRIEDKHDIEHHENLILMKIGQYNVLIAAEVDAIDHHGNPIEIKSGNPKYFGSKLVFQMISSNAQTLIHADKQRGSFQGVKIKSITNVLQEYVKNNSKQLQSKILHGLSTLKQQSSNISESKPSELNFNRSVGMTLKQATSNHKLLPKKHVIDELISIAEKSNSVNTSPTICEASGKKTDNQQTRKKK